MKLAPCALALVVFFSATPRLPAPIQEVRESPTPAPEQKAKPKRTPSKSNAKPQEEEPAKKAAPSKPKVSPFAGTWSGTVNGQYRSAEGQERATVPTNCEIQISHEGKTVSGKWHAFGPQVQQSPAISNGSTLTWSSQSPTPSAPLSTTSNCVLQMTSSTSATFTCNMTIITGFLKGAT
jgi:hypothetical protein